MKKHVIENPEIKQLLQKFILGKCTAQETEKVIAYCKANNITDAFPTVEEVKTLLNGNDIEIADADSFFADIMAKADGTIKLNTINRRKNNWMIYVASAACFVLLLLGGKYFMLTGEKQDKPKLQLDGTEITLQLENGDIQIIKEDGSTQIVNAQGNLVGRQDSTSIIYDNPGGIDRLVYNTLKIPLGKHFKLQLSDGTVVHLNAGTSVKYPVKFLPGRQRMVYLDGEAYFEVAKDKQHPFIVNANELNVRVLGTHFNVSNYPEDDFTDVVLAEGSVGLYSKGKSFDSTSTILSPGEKGSLASGGTVINVEPVSTQIYTAWVKGELVFRNMTFKNICTKLERQYNVKIINQNAKLASEKFNASFKNEPIEKVLGYFKELNGFNYIIKQNTITIL